MARYRDFDVDHIDPRWEEGRDYQLVCGLNCSLNLREEDPGVNTAKSNRFLPWRWCREEIGVVPSEPGDLALFLVGSDIENDIPGEWVLMEFMSDEWFKATKDTHGASVHNNLGKIIKWREDNPEKALENDRLLLENAKKWRAKNPEKVEETTRRLLKDLRGWREKNPETIRQNTQKLQEGRERFQEQNPDFLREMSPMGVEGLKRWREENPDLDRERLNKMRKGLEGWIENNPDKLIWNKKFRCTVTGKVTTAGPLTMYQRKRGIDPSNREPVN